MKKKKLTLTLSQAEYEEFASAAADAKLPVIEWARRRLLGMLPPAPAVMEEAFRRLDVSDRMRELSGKPVPPAVEPPEQRLVQIGRRIPSTHSCVNFAHVVREGGDHVHVCAYPAQLGRTCYWSSSGAMDCPYFLPRHGR